jgi:hypothetical protein
MENITEISIKVDIFCQGYITLAQLTLRLYKWGFADRALQMALQIKGFLAGFVAYVAPVPGLLKGTA